MIQVGRTSRTSLNIDKMFQELNRFRPQRVQEEERTRQLQRVQEEKRIREEERTRQLQRVQEEERIRKDERRILLAERVKKEERIREDEIRRQLQRVREQRIKRKQEKEEKKKKHQTVIITGYHQTDKECAESIIKNGFKCGTKGFAGAGIYFANSPQDTCGKAQRNGYMLVCKVDTGNTKLIEKAASNIDKKTLKREGFDSVSVTGGTNSDLNRPEFVIFEPYRVKEITEHYPCNKKGKKSIFYV